MGTKREELHPDARGCLAKAGDDEPLFVLRATDRLSPVVVRLWADLAQMVGCSADKVDEAMELAQAMENWPSRKWPD